MSIIIIKYLTMNFSIIRCTINRTKSIFEFLCIFKKYDIYLIKLTISIKKFTKMSIISIKYLTMYFPIIRCTISHAKSIFEFLCISEKCDIYNILIVSIKKNHTYKHN